MTNKRLKWSIVSVMLLAAVFSGSSASAQKLELEDHSACEYPAGFPALEDNEWRHKRSKLIAEMGSPRHIARDVATVDGSAVELQAKFTYGKTSKDLEDEKVRVLLQSCEGWTKVGEAMTDGDGWMSIDWAMTPQPGVYRLVFQQVADGTYATSKLWVVPRGTRVAVFDIDGTLTTSDSEAFKEVADSVVDDGEYAPKAYPGGRELIKHYVNKGYFVVYLTGRPYWYKERTVRWLESQGVAAGMLRLAPTHSDFWPSEGGVAAFKRAELEALIKEGLILDVAHGNASTDISAYIGAGLPKERIWIIGKHAGGEGTQPVEGDWNEILDRLRSAE